MIDVDGTLCPSIFNNDRLKNDNRNCLSPEFLNDLAAVEPYEWWCPATGLRYVADDGRAVIRRSSGRWSGQVCILVTGRLPAHEKLTINWFLDLCDGYEDGPAEISFVSVPWDDTCETREESYEKYVKQKVERLSLLVGVWCATMYQSHFDDYEIHVYEDDTNVLREMRKHLYYKDTDKGLHVVDNGEVHDYP